MDTYRADTEDRVMINDTPRDQDLDTDSHELKLKSSSCTSNQVHNEGGENDNLDLGTEKLDKWTKKQVETEMQSMSLAKFIVEKLYEDINDRHREQD